MVVKSMQKYSILSFYWFNFRSSFSLGESSQGSLGCVSLLTLGGSPDVAGHGPSAASVVLCFSPGAGRGAGHGRKVKRCSAWTAFWGGRGGEPVAVPRVCTGLPGDCISPEHRWDPAVPRDRCPPAPRMGTHRWHRGGVPWHPCTRLPAAEQRVKELGQLL